MNRLALLLGVFLGVGALAGCSEDVAGVPPPPHELTSAAIGYYCGMNLMEHGGPKGQIILASRSDPIWFSSARDAVSFTLLPEEPKDIRAIYVSDMAKAPSWDDPGTKNWIDARKGFFVIGSRVAGLYRADSVLCELNRRGVLIGPPVELLELLTLCDHFWQLTAGVFDPTVQPLWQCYAEHFAAGDQTIESPSEAKLRAALELVGWEKLRFNRNSIVFNRRGMGLTLNGIAQGYITDRVVELLHVAGIESSLADMGEIRALGATPEGQPWRVSLEDPSGEVLAGRSIPIINKAVSTSCAVGFRFDEQGRCNHLFDPSTGACADPLRSLTVIAATAATADALSTAFALMDEERIRSVLSRWGGTEAYITTESGTRVIAATSGRDSPKIPRRRQ